MSDRPGWMLGMNQTAMTDPTKYAQRLLTVCTFYPTAEEWGARNGRELRAVIAALLADREQPGVVLTFENGQVIGWDRP